MLHILQGFRRLIFSVFSYCPSLLYKRSAITFHTATILIKFATRRQSESPPTTGGLWNICKSW